MSALLASSEHQPLRSPPNANQPPAARTRMALEIQSVGFGCMDAQRVRRLSVVQVALPDVINNLGPETSLRSPGGGGGTPGTLT